MQDIHAIGGGAAPPGVGGRLFAGGSGGSGGGGDRRLRPHNSQGHQALKCPRCESLNTKFCYYNNYNLSQPRHFCKSCRRYWTKGGVLRNVPVGGGCRKAKRSKPKASANSSEVAALAREADSNSHSSSESSSLTVTTTAAKNCAAAGSSGEVASATVNSSNSPSNLLNFQGSSRFFVPQINASSGFDQQQPLIDPSSVSSNGQIFQEIGSFTSLITTSNDPAMLGFNMADVSTYQLQQNDQGSVVEEQCSNPMVGTTGDDDLKMEQISCGFLDQSAHIGFTGMQQQSRVSNGGLAGLDWQINGGGGGGGSDQGLFDFTGTVDQAYWGQNQWAADNDQSLNFPPLV